MESLISLLHNHWLVRGWRNFEMVNICRSYGQLSTGSFFNETRCISSQSSLSLVLDFRPLQQIWINLGCLLHTSVFSDAMLLRGPVCILLSYSFVHSLVRWLNTTTEQNIWVSDVICSVQVVNTVHCPLQEWGMPACRGTLRAVLSE